MITNPKFKIPNSQRGISLIITFFVMIIILAVVLSVSALLYGQIKVIKNIGDSVVAFYAADSGVEKVLFYDWQVLPEIESTGDSAKRGFCSMLTFDSDFNPYACEENPGGVNSGVYCDLVPDAPAQPEPLGTNGCNWDTCDNCKIQFRDAFGTFGERKYDVVASIIKQPDSSVNFEINSWGSFSGASRQIKVLTRGRELTSAFTVTKACAEPNSKEAGQEISVFACVKLTIPNDTIAGVRGYVYEQDPAPAAPNMELADVVTLGADPIPGISCPSGARKYFGTWSTPSGPAKTFYVDLLMWDSMGVDENDPMTNVRKIEKLINYPDCLQSP